MSARRTCVVCRDEADRADLVRIVLAPDGAPVIDYRGNLPGRGAWVHPQRACVDKLDARALSRAFKARVPAADLAGALRDSITRSLRDGLSQAAAAGLLLAGHDVVVRTLEGGRVTWLLMASDTADRTRESVEAARGEVPLVIVPLTRDQLGAQVGRAPVAVLAVQTGDASRHLRRQLRRLRDLG